MLAVQNMEASGVFRKDDIEFTALEGSLTMMSKVLNDVLDLYASFHLDGVHRADIEVLATEWTPVDSNPSQSHIHSTRS